MTPCQESKHKDSIFVIHDETANLKVLLTILTEHGYAVHHANEGELRLQLQFVKHTLPDLVLVDVRMPGMDGYQVCASLKNDPLTRVIPVIFISSIDHSINQAKALLSGAVDYIAEPFDAEEVLWRVETHISLHRIRENLKSAVRKRTAQPVTTNEELEGALQEIRVLTQVAGRKHAEEKIREQEAELRQVLDLAPQHIVVLGPEGSHLYSNQAALNYYGLTLEQWRSYDARTLFHPDDCERMTSGGQIKVLGESPLDTEARLMRKDGKYRWFLIRRNPLRDGQGHITHWYIAATDVEDRKRADEERERLLANERAAFAETVAAQQRFRDLVNSVEGIVWEADVPSFQFLFISKQAERVLGYPVERWLSEPTFWKDHVHPDDQEWALRFCQTATTEKRDHEFEYRMIAADGSVVWLRDLVTVVMEGDRVTRARGVMVDLTNRKRAEEALREAQANLARVSRVTTMGELTASLAHEIKQPITAAVTDAKTCLRWIGRDQPDVEEAREAAARIIKDVTRATDIISRISLLFKKGAVQRELVDANELIREMIVLLRGEANRYSISIRAELAEDLPKVMADPVQLQQVFMNLMLNGIEAMKGTSGGGELTIKSKAGDGQLLISVSDTGVGLPPEQADQIFRAFFTTKDNGTGMGLPISRSIIESHGGRLWAANAPGRGATFQFTLPATLAAHA